MNAFPQIFNHQDFKPVRIIDIEGKPFAVGIDVARNLEYSNPSKAVIDHCKGITKLGIPSAGGEQETNVIPEGDIYRLIMKAADQSKNELIKAKAQKFESWIFDEVIPSIRKHGAYMSPEAIEKTLSNPDFIITLATELKKEQEKRASLEQQILDDSDKVFFAKALQTSKDAILVGQLATQLKQNGVNIGEKRLFSWLREEGYLCKSGERYNLPTQRSMELKLFEVKTTMYGNGEDIKVRKTPKVTGRGQEYFINKFQRYHLRSTS
ncbi:anti-repressor protein [Paenibacillus jamilae]|jgi:anti-repressor protein|uniref:phage antirepressor KilAC domain-containing protein n=1 Tax=Paenibacillus polymyxa TaxID=1406 RepID=UPI001580719F|nr:phage antirepressor KilAC domain-containing protein [Paenibacillus polymyxa]MDP9676233.1 anti-repressor protein [Paenibacillus jamilae]MBY0020768.1 phage antirepressor KilAC domain-containing protein [Paenibacillus polymyxa]MBY0059072.1 phage antirepressor KilAC domain-containing protein [Paenibacillus polymyxa]MBY0069659.1 phage antirepressor KilAC domain-containing protein [Paenibacillus polymyxa]MBY0083276.1 phage antirepressor KilAC domain-containing protein [Paenibacillus polymyxa]